MLICDRCRKGEKQLNHKPERAAVLLQYLDQYGQRFTQIEVYADLCSVCRKDMFGHIKDYVAGYVDLPELKRSPT